MEIKPAYVTFEQYESYCDLKLLQLLYNKGFRFKLSEFFGNTNQPEKFVPKFTNGKVKILKLL